MLTVFSNVNVRKQKEKKTIFTTPFTYYFDVLDCKSTLAT